MDKLLVLNRFVVAVFAAQDHSLQIIEDWYCDVYNIRIDPVVAFDTKKVGQPRLIVFGHDVYVQIVF